MHLNNWMPPDTCLWGTSFFSGSFCAVVIKWSKTLQDRKNFQTISIPDPGSSLLCPIQALNNMFKALPASPLFCIWRDSEISPVTDLVARKHLKRVSSILDVDLSLTFHMFRKSATTWAFHKGMPMQDIMQHGTWSSTAVWRYIQSQPAQSSQVSRTCQHHLYLQ